jgi:hypothetical protein
MRLKQLIAKYNDVDLFLANLLIEVQSIAEKNPEFVYSNHMSAKCNYNGPATGDDDEVVGPECSGCLIGQGLQALGWSDAEELFYFGDFINLMNDIGELEFDCSASNEDSLSVKIYRIQVMQDAGHSWGACV